MTTYAQAITRNEIERGIRSLNLGKAKEIQPTLQAESQASLIQKAIFYYKGVAPLIHYFMLGVPKHWAAGLNALLDVLDRLAAAPIAAPIAAVAADTTTTDPTSSDGSFKAGKDL